MKRKGLWIALAVVVVGLVGGCGKEEIPRPEVLRLGKEHLDRAWAYMEKDEDDKAIEECTKVIRMETNSGENMIKVDAYFCRAHLYLHPARSWRDNLRVEAYLKESEFDKAIEEYSKTISLEASLGEKFIGMAIEDLSKAISLNPNEPSSYAERGDVYCEIGEFDKAIKDYSLLIQMATRDYDDPMARAQPYERRARAYAAKGEDEKAAADFSKAEELYGHPLRRHLYHRRSPRLAYLARTYIKRGHLYLEKGERDRAIEDFSKAISLNPNDPEAVEDRARAYKAKGESEKAAADFLKAKELKAKAKSKP